MEVEEAIDVDPQETSMDDSPLLDSSNFSRQDLEQFLSDVFLARCVVGLELSQKNISLDAQLRSSMQTIDSRLNYSPSVQDYEECADHRWNINEAVEFVNTAAAYDPFPGFGMPFAEEHDVRVLDMSLYEPIPDRDLREAFQAWSQVQLALRSNQIEVTDHLMSCLDIVSVLMDRPDLTDDELQSHAEESPFDIDAALQYIHKLATPRPDNDDHG